MFLPCEIWTWRVHLHHSATTYLQVKTPAQVPCQKLPQQQQIVWCIQALVKCHEAAMHNTNKIKKKDSYTGYDY